jgi:HSP20 family protein
MGLGRPTGIVPSNPRLRHGEEMKKTRMNRRQTTEAPTPRGAAPPGVRDRVRRLILEGCAVYGGAEHMSLKQWREAERAIKQRQRMKGQESNIDRSPFLASLSAVPVCKRRIADTDWFPAVDVSETGEEYLFECDLPGLTREEIQVRVEGGALCLTGVRRTLRHEGMRLRIERPAGAFFRQVVLPADSCGNALQVTLQDGVLQLRIPKKTARGGNEKSSAIGAEESKYDPMPS